MCCLIQLLVFVRYICEFCDIKKKPFKKEFYCIDDRAFPEIFLGGGGDLPLDISLVDGPF